MLEKILHWDYRAFQHINQVWISPSADLILPWLREPLLWTPLYVFLCAYVLCNSPSKKASYGWLLYLGLLILLCDGISSQILKRLVFRPRPCIDPIWQDKVRVLVSYCSQRSSFSSSHAANHFGMAMFFVLSLRKLMSRWVLLFWLWALAICYAQVYVGLHYPLDIVRGGLLGILSGYLLGRAYNRTKAC